MSKTEALISLIGTLSRTEKRSVVMHSRLSGGEKDYLSLFNLVCSGVDDKDELRRRFVQERPGTSFDTACKYLYKVILDRLVEMRIERDSEFDLTHRLFKVRVLFEKSLYREGLSQLQKIQHQATRTENHLVMLQALHLELEVLTGLDFADLSEKQLIRRQTRLQETIRVIRNIQEHSFLYELLRYRLSRKSNVSTTNASKVFEDLIFSELNIVNKLNVGVFDISKKHLLFQANYFIGIGDSNQALRSFIELNALFEKNPHLWQNPPIYYLNVLEGALSSLRSIGRYGDMDYFLDQLARLQSSYSSFRLEVMSVIFLYRMFALLDYGRYEEALALKWTYEEPLLANISQLNVNRQAEVILYVSLLHYLNGNLATAKRTLNQVVFKGKDFAYLALYRAIRMVNLIYMYESGETDLIKYESRSIQRELKEYSHPDSLEEFFLRFVNTPLPVTMSKRMELWGGYARNVTRARKNNMDRKVLNIFDFISWIESKVRKCPMSEIVRGAHNV